MSLQSSDETPNSSLRIDTVIASTTSDDVATSVLQAVRRWASARPSAAHLSSIDRWYLCCWIAIFRTSAAVSSLCPDSKVASGAVNGVSTKATSRSITAQYEHAAKLFG